MTGSTVDVRPPRRLPAAAVAAGLAGLLLLAGALWLYWDGSSRRAAESAGADAVAAARESIPAILSYQPATAEQDLPAAARDRLTGRFRADYTQAITTVVVPEAKQKGVTARATVPAAAVVSADRRHAVVLAYVDQSLTVGAGRDMKAPTDNKSTVRVTMDNIDGRWLISGFDQEG
jgi:Mce-associated membrane protein